MIKIKPNNQKGFAVIESLLILVIIAVISGIGWYAIHTKRQTDRILSQADKISQSTPVASKNSSTSGQAMSQKYLIFKEWGVKMPIANDETELTYQPMNPDTSSQPIDGFDILSPSIAKLCGAGWDGNASHIMRISINDSNLDLVAAYKKELGTSAVKLGNYYYMIGGIQNSCSDIAAPKEHAIADTLLSEFLQLTDN